MASVIDKQFEREGEKGKTENRLESAHDIGRTVNGPRAGLVANEPQFEVSV